MKARWRRQRLEQFAAERLSGRRFVVVSNREPYIHSLAAGRITWQQPVGGLTEALDPVLRACRGIWVAQGSGEADRQVVDAHDRIAVPPDHPEYTLRRVWLSEGEVTGYYAGFANRGLWPLCHETPVLPEFKKADWQTYARVNRTFTEAALQESGGQKALVLVQDYHLALVPGYLRTRDRQLTIGLFWHIPWPSYARLKTCPWYGDIIRGMLGSDLIGFHTRSYCQEFLEAAGRLPGADINHGKGTVSFRGRMTLVEPFPISVDFARISRQAHKRAVSAEMARLCQTYHLEGKIIGIGMDRVDYTKGIPQRLRALEMFFEDNPTYRGKVVYILAGMPSRTDIATYQETLREVEGLIHRLNARYGDGCWQPVIPMMCQLSPLTLSALRRLAHFCIVSSLHDGMNLVAKEFVAARADGDGVLLLSRFTGAAEELTEALLINPNDTCEFAAKIRQAIEMPEPERRQRMAAMRRVVAENNIYYWGASLLSRLMGIAGG